MIGQVINKVLTDNTAISDLVGPYVFPLVIPHGKPYPSITYQIISKVPTKCKGDVSPLDKVRVQINVLSESYQEMETLASEVRDTLDGFNGTVLGLTFRSDYNTERDLHEKDANVFHKSTDYTFTVQR